MLFLSYATEDSEVAVAVADWLSEHVQDDVYLWRTGQPIPTINATEERISQAHGYVALLSPDFPAAPLCRRERELAMSREQDPACGFPAHGSPTFFTVGVRPVPARTGTAWER